MIVSIRSQPMVQRPGRALLGFLRQGTVIAACYAVLLPATSAPQTSSAERKKTQVEGRVISQTGEGISRASVELHNGQAFWGQPLYSNTSDDAGKFIFDDVAPGSYTLQVVKAGFLRAYGLSPGNAMPTPFTLAAGDAMKDVIVRLTPQSVITGRVTNQDGDPMPRTAVSIYSVAYVRGRKTLNSQARNVQTDDEGNYRVAGLTPGRYYVGVWPRRALCAPGATARPTTADVSTFYPNALDAAGAAPLDVPAGARLDRIDIRTRRERIYSIQGRVTLHGDPADGAVMVFAKGANSNDPRTVAAARQGVFEVCGLSAGTYVVEAASTTPRLAGRAEVTVANSNVDQVVLSLEPALTISGEFRSEDGDLQSLAKSATAPPPPSSPFDADILAALAKLWEARGQTSNLKPTVRLFPTDGSDFLYCGSDECRRNVPALQFGPHGWKVFVGSRQYAGQPLREISPLRRSGHYAGLRSTWPPARWRSSYPVKPRASREFFTMRRASLCKCNGDGMAQDVQLREPGGWRKVSKHQPERQPQDRRSSSGRLLCCRLGDRGSGLGVANQSGFSCILHE